MLVSTVQGVGNTIVTHGFHVLSYVVLTIVTYFRSLIALTTAAFGPVKAQLFML